MRISDWSSDVCSSDLWSVLVIKCLPGGIVLRGPAITASEKATNRSRFGALIQYSPCARCHRSAMMPEATPKPVPAAPHRKIGRASCRESVSQYVEILGVAVSLKKDKSSN